MGEAIDLAVAEAEPFIGPVFPAGQILYGMKLVLIYSQ
jgi:hypothetical protein